jgi:hypothetical protein
MISRIIQTEVNVICRSEAEADNIDRGLNNSWCHAKSESNHCFIIHLKTPETYKTIKQSSVILQVYLFSRAFEFELLEREYIPGTTIHTKCIIRPVSYVQFNSDKFNHGFSVCKLIPAQYECVSKFGILTVDSWKVNVCIKIMWCLKSKQIMFDSQLDAFSHDMFPLSCNGRYFNIWTASKSNSSNSPRSLHFLILNTIF